MSHPCGRARRVLWTDDGPRVLTDELEGARAHVTSCEACRGFLREVRSMRALLREGVPRPPAPRAVREGVLQAVALERAERADPSSAPVRAGIGGRRARGRWWRRSGVIAAVVVLAVSVAYAFVQWAGSPTTMNGVATYVEDHLRSLHGGSIRSSDPEAVRRWLSRRVAFAVTVPRLPAARLEGGRLCFLEGREGVVVHYRLEGKLVSYYVMPGGTETGGPGADDFRSEANRGYHVVVWHRAGLTYALVADLPRARLSELAHVCADAIVAVRTADPVARASRPIVGTSRASVTP